MREPVAKLPWRNPKAAVRSPQTSGEIPSGINLRNVQKTKRRSLLTNISDHFFGSAEVEASSAFERQDNHHHTKGPNHARVDYCNPPIAHAPDHHSGVGRC